jgi:hypothetical protein
MQPRDDSSWYGLPAVLALLGTVLVLTGCAVLRGGGTAHPTRFDIGLIGDLPYSAADEQQFPHLMQAVNDANLAFVVHNGDFKSGVSPCSTDLFASRLALFHTSKHPLIYLPGDNEWTDCHREPAGGYDPLERLVTLRQMFFPGDQSLGQRPLPLTRQSSDPPYAKFRENVRWTYGDVVFVGLHVVGSNNNLGRTPAADAEYVERNAATMVWLKQGFELAKRQGAKGLMLIMQANPYIEDRWPDDYVRGLRIARPPSPPSGFSDFLTALETEVLAFEKPIVLVHGDTHYFRMDKPLFSPGSTSTITHFTRVETFGTPNMHWVRATIDPADPQVFQFKPELGLIPTFVSSAAK